MIEPLRDSELLADVFDAYPAPTLLVDDDVRVLHANRAARDLLGLRGDGSDALLTRGGELLHCVNAAAHPDGCGHADACKKCVIRNSVGAALSSGAVRRARAFMQLRNEGRLDEAHFLISAAPLLRNAPRAEPGRPLVILTLEDVSEIVRLRSLLPICAGCRKIRDGENYWRTVEEYFKRSLDIDFSHSFCEACAERLYPEMRER
jgi:PAS domain-containing protein